MPPIRATRWTPVLCSMLFTACTSAAERFEQGVALQAQGRYAEAAFRYADAVEKDGSLAEARRMLRVVGDSAVHEALVEAERLGEGGDPVGAARRYEDADRVLARARAVGERLDPPSGYRDRRRDRLDRAISWLMSEGDRARVDGRWTEARGLYHRARTEFEPSDRQVRAALDAESALLLEWSEVEISDGRPRAGHHLAAEAAAIWASPPRDVLLASRELERLALELGTVVIVPAPVGAPPELRATLGPSFEVALDEALGGDFWSAPPPFVEVAYPDVFREELRSVLGRVRATPGRLARAAGLVGADLVVWVELIEAGSWEEDVTRTTRATRVYDGGPTGRSREPRPSSYDEVRGVLALRAAGQVRLLDLSGRLVDRFGVEASAHGPFLRGEFDGNPERLELSEAERALFDPLVRAEQESRVQTALLDELAATISGATFEAVLATIP